MRKTLSLFILSLFTLLLVNSTEAQYQMEYLDRGVVAMKRTNDVYISWRMFGTETMSTSYNIYRNGTKINNTPITTTTNYVDAGGNTNSTYTVSAIINGVEQAQSKAASTWADFYKEISLNKPADGVTPPFTATVNKVTTSYPNGQAYDYSPNDATVADLDGDGEYEIIFKWYPSNAHDNAHDGFTGPTYIEAIKLDGTSLWRIDLGKNMRSGAHYVEMQVYDFDGDGKAEVALRTADGTVDGKGKVIGNANADYRSSVGRVLSGPEFLTMFNGETGAEMSTVNYVPGRGSVAAWGDGYGNRVDRFLSGVAHLGGAGNPSLLMCRGYYTRMVVAAWDFVGGKLQQRWVFDTDNNMNHLKGKGNHQISVADVDGDGKQEVIYGAVVIDDNGTPLNYNTWGHGDALHVGDFDVSNPGLEIFMPIEYASSNPADKRPGFVMRDAKTSNILWQVFRDGDIGRGNCANIDSRYPGAECWASGGDGLYDAKGNVIGNTPSGCNHSIWWDGDFTRELLDGTKLDNWDEAWDNGKGGNGRMVTIYNYAGASPNNGTKSNPNLTADILGDWREEMLYRNNTNDKLILFSTNYVTNHKLYTLMHDAQYRTAIAWQSTGYNQPPHPSFYIGEDMTAAPTPNIKLVSSMDCFGDKNGRAYIDDCGTCVAGNTGLVACVLDCHGDKNGTASVDECGICSGGNTGLVACNDDLQAENFCIGDGILEATNSGFIGEGYFNYNNATGTSATWNIVSASNQTVQIGIRYANGGASARGLNVVVNNNQQATVTGNNTEDWSTWVYEYFSLNLVEGVNLLKLTATSADGGPNVDLFVLPTNVTAGGCSIDCNGVLGGSAYKDSCNVCVSGNTGKIACALDCHGDWGGTASIDDCGVCVGGNTSFKACTGTLEAETACEIDGVASEAINTGFTGVGYANTNNVIGAQVSWFLASTSNQKATFTFRYANGGTSSRDGIIKINGNLAGTLVLPSTGSWTTWNMVTINLDLVQGSNGITIEATTADGLANLDLVHFSAGVSDEKCLVTAFAQTPEMRIGLYPNPTEGLVTWDKNEDWILRNAQGITLEKGFGNQLNLDSYHSGLYLLIINQVEYKIYKN